MSSITFKSCSNIEPKEVCDSFFNPPGARVMAVASAKTTIWQVRAPLNHSHLLYTLENCIEREANITPLPYKKQYNFGWLYHWITNKIQHHFVKRTPHYVGDVLMVIDAFDSQSHTDYIRLLIEIARSGRKVLCLVDFTSDEYEMINTAISEAGVDDYAQCVDPLFAGRHLFETIARQLDAKFYTIRDHHWLRRNLPRSLILRSKAYTEKCLYQSSIYRIAWEAIAPFIDFQTLIVRHRYHLSSVVASHALENKKFVISLQDNMVMTPYDYLPILAHRFVSFGKNSSNIIRSSAADFEHQTGIPSICSDFIYSDLLCEQVDEYTNPLRYKTVLVVIPPESKANYHGYKRENDIFWHAVEDLILNAKYVDRILIRMNTDSRISEQLQAWKLQYPKRIELAHPVSKLKQNLAESSVIIGLYDSALIAAAKAGIPAFFLWDKDWFYTPDIAPFQKNLFVSPSGLTERVDNILSDNARYEEMRTIAYTAACQYSSGNYEGSQTTDFIDRLLAH